MESMSKQSNLEKRTRAAKRKSAPKPKPRAKKKTEVQAIRQIAQTLSLIDEG